MLTSTPVPKRCYRSGPRAHDSKESIGGLLVTEVRKPSLDELRDMLIVEGVEHDLPGSARRNQLQRAEDS